ncbi:predicted protein, partial [Nematostella vectensis]
ILLETEACSHRVFESTTVLPSCSKGTCLISTPCYKHTMLKARHAISTPCYKHAML